jgi:hypothetical protein
MAWQGMGVPYIELKHPTRDKTIGMVGGVKNCHRTSRRRRRRGVITVAQGRGGRRPLCRALAARARHTSVRVRQERKSDNVPVSLAGCPNQRNTRYLSTE